MSSKSKPPEIPLPKGWGAHVKSAILHIIALAQYINTALDVEYASYAVRRSAMAAPANLPASHSAFLQPRW